MHSNQYGRHSVVSLEEGLKAIGDNLDMPMKKERVPLNGIPVHVTSLRLRTFFLKGVVCPCCGIKATHFAIEKDAKSKFDFYHLNLYATHETLGDILFTHDHIVARANGGKDNLENAQPMCGPCNWIKADK